MKTISGLMKHLYLKRVGIFLIAVALIVGTVGCEAGGAEVGPLDHFKWYLADGVESIDEVVYLEDQFCAVEATVGYVVGFGNPAEKVHSEVTTPISNPDHHLTGYEITYEEEPQTWFVEVENQFGTQELTVWGPFGLAVPTQKEGHQPPVGLDHYLVYEVVDGPSVDVSVSVQDEFDAGPQEAGVYEPMYFANPVRKTHGEEVAEILDPEAHLVFYYIDADFEGEVEVVNQFGEQTLDVYSLLGFGALAVPSEKLSYEPVYSLTMAANPVGGGTATDQTGGSPYAAGTDVSIQAVANPGYSFVSWTAPAGGFTNANDATTTFTTPAQSVTVTANFVGPLDHFKWYYADSVEAVDEIVYLEDQFGAFNATVGYAAGFGNPAWKERGEVTTPISNPDHHLAGYYIDYEEEPQTWFVEVENQFGIQNLTVWGPVALAVPTQKLVPGGHQPPVGLDHFLVYEVIEGSSVDVSVSLQDEFDAGPQESWVYEPMYFATPVRKTHGEEVTEILDPETHLVFYMIDASFSGEVGIVNQFGQQTLDVYTFFGFGALAVPSEKLSYEPVYSLTMAADPEISGTATDLTDASPYAAGTVVSIKAEAAAGYELISWSAPAGTFGDANAAETTFTMPAQDVTVTANFALVSCNLTISSTGGGSVTTPGQGTFTYDRGTVVDLVAEAAPGGFVAYAFSAYAFSEWTGDVDTIADVYAASTNITMDDNYSITATWYLLPF